MNRTIITSAFVIFSVAVIAGAFVYSYFTKDTKVSEAVPAAAKGPILLDLRQGESGPKAIAPRIIPNGWSEYADERYGFSLHHPADLKTHEYDEGHGARTITFETEGGERGFQIFIVPHDREYIDENRFRLDAPSGVIEEQMEVLIDGIRAVAFFSEQALMGETREVWFIHDGYLFEVTTYRELDEWLAKIMATWDFRK